MCGFIFLEGKVQEEKFKKSLAQIKHRGPDSTGLRFFKDAAIGFQRLAIIDLSARANQPFIRKNLSVVCNGEIYNHKKLKEIFTEYQYESKSDCEVLLPAFEKWGIEKLCQKLDGEYAFVIYDEKSKKVIAARDPMGIRPLFYGENKKTGGVVFASEVKALKELAVNILPFPPGHFYEDGKIKVFHDHCEQSEYLKLNQADVYEGIRKHLVDGVVKRLDSDAKLGFLLSGGLDSSLVCSIAQKHSKDPIKTFAIGMSGDAIDLKYAKEVAEYIGSDHTEVIIDKKDVLSCLKDVIYHLESWDITTVRASIGMYLVCKYIKENTDIKVVLTGEVSDEIFGYKYTDFAPGPLEFQQEAQKRVKELYIYDVLRADRCISSHSLEARVPFSDQSFVDFVMGIDPKIKMNTYGQGKYILRKAFEGDYLPDSILYREKAAFSDAVGHSMVDYLKEYAESLYIDNDLEAARFKYPHKTPFTKESLLYRDLFESFYPKQGALIKDFWMPNKDWENCDVQDPSARVLPNYGSSGN